MNKIKFYNYKIIVDKFGRKRVSLTSEESNGVDIFETYTELLKNK